MTRNNTKPISVAPPPSFDLPPSVDGWGLVQLNLTLQANTKPCQCLFRSQEVIGLFWGERKESLLWQC